MVRDVQGLYHPWLLNSFYQFARRFRSKGLIIFPEYRNAMC
jgi:hypothetical protein